MKGSLNLITDKMNTCVLFPHAFCHPYLDGSAARKSTVPISYELHYTPEELGRHSGGTRRNKNLSLLSNLSYAYSKQSLSLLHVEDNPQLRVLFSAFLKNQFDVLSVGNGADALKEAENRKYDIVCVDINLGDGIDGFEISRRLRELDQYQQTPIIALTTLNYQNVREECLDSRINAYIQKPFDKMSLIGILEELDTKVLKNFNSDTNA